LAAIDTTTEKNKKIESVGGARFIMNGPFLPVVRIGTPVTNMHEYLQAIAICTVKLNNVLVPLVEAFGCVSAHCADVIHSGQSFFGFINVGETMEIGPIRNQRWRKTLCN
jgi:hypothetical protein